MRVFCSARLVPDWNHEIVVLASRINIHQTAVSLFFSFSPSFLGQPIELLTFVPMIDSNQGPGTSGRSVTAFGNFQSKRPLWTPRAEAHIIGSRKRRIIWKKKRRKKANRGPKLPAPRRGLKSTVRKHSRIRGGPSHPSSQRVG